MDRVSHYLINIPEPLMVQTSIYQVVGSAIRLTASGLSSGDIVQIQVFVGDGDLSHGTWVDLYRCGFPVQLTPTTTQHMECVGGKYRVIYDGDHPVKVWAETNDLNLDKNVVYAFTNPCCQSSGGGGAGFTVLDTPSIDLTLAGTVLSADSKISADAGNEISIHADGLFAPAYTVSDTSSIDLTLTVNDISGVCKISADTGNIISIHADGLFATGGGGGSITVTDTNSIDLTLVGTALSADSKISATAGNIISINADGLFATATAAAFNMPFTDETINFTLGATYHAYRAASSSLNITFPSPATNTGQIYVLETRSDTGPLLSSTLLHGAVQINGAALDVDLPSGMVCLAYSTGANYNICNFLQLAPAQGAEGGDPNALVWIPGPYGTGGAFVATPTTPTYTSSYSINGGETRTITHTDELYTNIIADSNLAASTINLPTLSFIGNLIINVYNVGGGASNLTIHPFGTEKINGVNADYALLPGKGIILVSYVLGTNFGWYVTGGV